MRLSLIIAAATLAFVSLATAAPLAAQKDPDVIRGTVTGSDSVTIAGANVTVIAVGTSGLRQEKTDRRGTFTVVFPSAEGDYWITVSALGYVSRRFNLKRVGDEAVLVADVELDKIGAQVLRPVISSGRRPPPRPTMNRDITGNDITMSLSTLGIDLMSDPNALAMFLPDAIFTPGADGGAGSFSLYGLDADQNTFTLNGLQLGLDGLPRDAGITGTLSPSPDASRAGGAGGQLDAIFGAGNNFIQRQVSFTGRSPKIQWSDAATKAVGNQPTRLSLGGLASGPIRANALFYKLAWQYDDNSYALRSLLNTDPLGLTAAGLAPDSVGRLRDVLGTLGVPLTVSAVPGRNRTRSGSVIGGISYTPPRSRWGSLSATFLANGAERAPTSGSLLYEMPGHSGRSTTASGSVGATHSVMLHQAILSTTTVGGSVQQASSGAFLSLPSASVRVPSALEDGSTVVRSVLVGGSPSLDRGSTTSGVQASNALKWVSLHGRYSFTLGTNVGHRTFRTDLSTNRLGSYSFASIADLESNRPASFDRTLTPRVQQGGQRIAGIGINAWWKPDSVMDMSAGVRLDASRYDRSPVRNRLVEELFGPHNDWLPRPFTVSPRLSFTRRLGTSPLISEVAGTQVLPRFVLVGQAGVFETLPSVQLPVAATENTGLRSGLQRLSCTGDAVPVPDWTAAFADPSNIPTACADGSVAGFSSAVPSVALIDRGYRGVRRTSGTLQLGGPVLWNWFSLNLRLVYARNTHLSRAVDLNFDPTVRFALADEEDRPVFALASAITPSSGRFAAAGARRFDVFDRVSELHSDLRGDSRTLSIGLKPLGYHPTFGYSLSYTMQANRQMVPGSVSTTGSPLGVAWGENNLGQTHRFLIGLSANIRNTVRVNWNIQFASGAPITPRVAGDINGDGYSGNDRAFIFDPATARDGAVGAGMRQLLTSGSSIAQRCLGEQLGRLSGLAACRGPWTFQGGNALRVLINPLAIRMPQRVAIQFEIGNPMGAADLLMHGADRIHGWGRPPTPDQTLLVVRGFDAVERRFLYDVNPRFGSTRPRENLNRAAPVTFTALVKVDVGPSRERQTLTDLLDRGRRNDDPRATDALLKYTLGRGGVPNPVISMLLQSDVMKLTADQTDTLSQLSRWFALHLDSVWTPAVRALVQLPRDYSRGEAYAIYMAAREQSFDLMIAMAPRAKAMLAPSQVRLLPAILQAYLDVRYLRAQRSSSIGMSDGLFPLGGAAPTSSGRGG